LPERPIAKLGALSGLRFFAAFAILLHHSRGTFISADATAGWPFGTGVSFFFVLSGFILTYAYPALPTAAQIGRFWLARIARLWPVHVVTLVAIVIVFPSQRFSEPRPLLANIFMLHGWIPLETYFFGGNAVSWSISTELGFYVLFPLLIWSLRSNWLLTLLGAAVSVVAMILIASQLPDSGGLYTATAFGLLYFNPISRLMEFTIGMCAMLLWHNMRPAIGSNFLAWSAAEVASIALLLAYIASGREYMYSPTEPGIIHAAQQWARRVDLAPMFAVIIFIMASGTGAIGRFIAWRPIVFLGEISFSLYMVHQPVIAYLARYPDLLSLPAVVKFPIVAAIALMLATLTYLFIERPGRAMILGLPRAVMSWRRA
jgi:peptidoglycan/LPS O-acetylase OafA/YrhL